MGIQKLIPFHSSISERVRTTNFSQEYTSVIWRVYDKRFRKFLELWGLPNGSKSELIQLPNGPFSKIDYFRGIIDGDGSVGLTSNGFPFLSLVTSSSSIATEYLNFIQQVTGKTKQINRDRIYNIVVYKEDAQLLVTCLYYENCLAVSRKLAKAQEVLNWHRPVSMKRVLSRKRWTSEEDDFVLTHSIETSIEALSRNRNSIELRLWRLKKLREQLVTD